MSEMLGSDRVGALLSAGMPGQHGAAALADVLLGKVAPSGERGWSYTYITSQSRGSASWGPARRGNVPRGRGRRARGRAALPDVPATWEKYLPAHASPKPAPTLSTTTGRLPVTWFQDSYVEQLAMTDPRMRAAEGFPGA